MISMLLSEAAASLQCELAGADQVFNGCSTDSRSVGEGELFIALRGDRYDGHEYVGQALGRGAVAAMVESRYTDRETKPLLIVDDTRTAMGTLAGYWRGCFQIPLVAVTGSNGKTTVKEMVTSVLSQEAPVLSTRGNLNNDIGVPMTLFSLNGRHRYAVIEMGANHPGEIAALTRMARPTVALITQCAPAHLAGFGSIEGVARAKAEIFEGLDQGGTAIINADDDYAGLWYEKVQGLRQVSFSMKPGADVHATAVTLEPALGGSQFTLQCGAMHTRVSLPLPGIHNIQNALAAAACCFALGIGLDTIRAGLEQVKSIRGRLQLKQGKQGVRICDDTYNANPASLRAALQAVAACPGRHWLILGDMGELGDSAEPLHYAAGEEARAAGFEKLFALGPLSARAVAGFGAGALHFSSVDSLIDTLNASLAADICVLVKGSRAMGMERIVQAIGGDN